MEQKNLNKMTLKERIAFYFDDLETLPGKAVDFAIILLIFILCVTFVISTYDTSPEVENILHSIEYVIIIIFIIEFILRFWVAEKKVHFFFNIYTLIDLISIIPFFFTFSNLQFVRIFRVLRVFRILRFLRYLKDDRFFFGKIREDNLIIVRIIFTIFSIVFVSFGLIYFEEVNHNDNINTFLDAIYFTIVTLTTVGFGDIAPQTEGGKVITLLMIISGVVFLPWQIGSLIRKFVATIEKTDKVCNSCGLKYHDKDAVHCKACGAIIYHEHE